MRLRHPPAQAVVAVAGRAAGIGHQAVPGVVGQGGARAVRRQVAVGVVGYRPGAGGAGDLVLGVGRARLRYTVGSDTRPVAKRVQRPALAVAGTGDGVQHAARHRRRQRAAREAGQLVERVIARGRRGDKVAAGVEGVADAAGVVQLAEGRVDRVVAVQRVAVAVVAVLEAVGGLQRARIVPVLIDDAAEAVQADVRVAAVARPLAALGDIGQVDAVALVAFHHRVQPQVLVRLQGAAAVRQRREPADAVVEGAGVVVGDRLGRAAAAGIGDARQPAVVGGAGHLVIDVANRGRRGQVHRPARRLVLGGQLAQAVVLALHLVDDIATRRRVVAGDEIGVALRVVGRGHAAHGAVDAATQRRHGVGHLPAEHVVAVGVEVGNRNDAVGVSEHLAQGVVGVRVRIVGVRIAGGQVGMLHGREQVVGGDLAAGGGTGGVNVLRPLVGAAGQVGLHGQRVAVAVVGVLHRLVGVVRRRAVGVGRDGFGHSAQAVVQRARVDAARVGLVLHPAGRVVGRARH